MAKKAATASAPSDAARDATFVFRGTVKGLKASTMPEVEPDDRTAIVRVDEVMKAPRALAGWAGKDITVKAGGRKKIKVGEQAVFYAQGWRFGDSIAVKSLDHHPVSAAPAGTGVAIAAAAAPLAAPGAAAAGPVQVHENEKLKRHVESADLIVAGRVSAVRQAQDAVHPGAPAGAALEAAVAMPGAAAVTPTRISEHDPIWHEAVIDVASIEKGATGGRQVVVRFPSSNDVRWRDYPKLQPGQEGVFLLQQGATAAAPALAVAEVALPGAGVAPAQVLAVGTQQPLSALGTIRSMLGPNPTPTQGAGGAGNASKR